MKRRPEPELMAWVDQALAYAAADFTESNTLFMQLLSTHWPDPPTKQTAFQALDIGCGPADLVARLLTAYPQAHCDALDGAAAMLDQARQRLARSPGVAARTRLFELTLPLPVDHQTVGLQPSYRLILSNSLLHHLHQPEVLWHTVQQVAADQAFVLMMDLMRPPTPTWAEALVRTYAKDDPAVLQEDFRNSLYAAFEPDEVQAQLVQQGLADQLSVAVVSDRHLAVWGTVHHGT